MFNAKPLLASAALAALVAAPAFALDLTTDVTLGAAPEDMTTVKTMEDSGFVGNEVRTKDQVLIGLVEAVYEGPDGAPVALVTLNTDIGAKASVKSFTVPLGADSAADGALTLAWTESELLIALDSTAGAQEGTNDSADDADGKGSDDSTDTGG